MLLILVVGMFFKYALDNESLIVVAGPIHGFLYVIYLITTVDLALKGQVLDRPDAADHAGRHHPLPVLRR